MPRAPKPCGRSGCSNRVRGRTYCDEHKPEPWAGSHRSADTSTSGWKRLRLAVLHRDDHRCQIALDGCLLVADQCDHITPLHQRPDQPLDPSLYQAACSSCHAKRSGSQGGQAAAPINRAINAGLIDSPSAGVPRRPKKVQQQEEWSPSSAIIKMG